MDKQEIISVISEYKVTNISFLLIPSFLP